MEQWGPPGWRRKSWWVAGRRRRHVTAGSVSTQRREASGIPDRPILFAQSEPTVPGRSHKQRFGSASHPQPHPNLPAPPTDQGWTTCTCSSAAMLLASFGSARSFPPPEPSATPPFLRLPSPATLVRNAEAPPSRKVEEGQQVHRLFSGRKKKKEKESRLPSKQRSSHNLRWEGAGPSRAGPRPGGGRLSSATQTAHCLPSRETNSFFQTQQGSQCVSSIHLHRRNRSFPSNEQFIENRSHLVAHQHSQVREQLCFGGAPREGFFHQHFSTLSCSLSLPTISNRSHHRRRQVFKAASFQLGSPPPPAGCFLTLLRSPTLKRVVVITGSTRSDTQFFFFFFMFPTNKFSKNGTHGGIVGVSCMANYTLFKKMFKKRQKKKKKKKGKGLRTTLAGISSMFSNLDM